MESGLNMLARLRREIADPPPAPSDDVPAEALPEPTRKQYQNARRRRDPLGEGQPATWRLLLIKVAATVVVSCRRIVIRLSGSWPNQHFFERPFALRKVDDSCNLNGSISKSCNSKRHKLRVHTNCCNRPKR